MRTATFVLTLALLASPPAQSDEAADFQALAAASKLKDHAKTHELALAFRAAHPTSAHTPEVTLLAGRTALQLARPARAGELLEEFLAAYATHSQADVARSLLLKALDKERRLEELVLRSAQFAREHPTSAQRDFWAYAHGDALFGLWRFAEAEVALLAAKTAFPTSPYLAKIDQDLAWINPRLEADANGLLAYRGKYVADARLLHLQSALPAILAEARATLRSTLGVDIGTGRVAYLEWVDSIADAAAAQAVTNTLCHEGKPASIISCSTEHAVTDERAFRSRLTHELKHAHFRNAMGQRYLALPRWVREGLAVYGARQTDDRLARTLSNHVFSGLDPATLLNGLEGAVHGYDDYLEDALAFEWLATKSPGAVQLFVAALLKGDDHKVAFGVAAGTSFDQAVRGAAAHAKDAIERALGPARNELETLNRIGATDDAVKRDAWFLREGRAAYEAWLAKHDDHVLAPIARYKLGKHLVLTGRYDEGRALLRGVFERDLARVTIADDAMYWYARAFERQGDQARAKEAYGALLRDYSWCRFAKELTAKHTPGPPLAALPAKGDPVR